jgi:hypothetical protein
MRNHRDDAVNWFARMDGVVHAAEQALQKHGADSPQYRATLAHWTELQWEEPPIPRNVIWQTFRAEEEPRHGLTSITFTAKRVFGYWHLPGRGFLKHEQHVRDLWAALAAREFEKDRERREQRA